MQLRKPERLERVCVGVHRLIMVHALRCHGDTGTFGHTRPVRKRKVCHRLADQHH